MTTSLSGSQIMEILKGSFGDSIVEVGSGSLLVKSGALLDIAAFLKNTTGLEFDFLSSITGTDYKGCFELVYHLESFKHNRSLILKVRCPKDEPAAPSLTRLWQGADFQEREIYDLLGVSFSGHPNMKRIFLWDGFEGYPLRKDFENGA